MTIDLGELDEPGQPGAGRRGRPPRASRPLRPARPALAVLLLLTAVLLGPAVPAQRMIGTEVVQPAGYDGAFVVGEMLLAFTADSPGGGTTGKPPELAAFRLPELTPLWQTAVSGITAAPGVVEDAVQVGDVLLVTMWIADPDGQPCATWALAVEDGRTLRCDADLHEATSGRALLPHTDGRRSTPRDDLEAWSLLDDGRRAGERVIAVRPVAGDRILVAELGSAGAGPELLGVLHNSISDCRSVVGGISCRRLDGGRSLLALPG